MDNVDLAGLAGVVISLAFSYVPGLSGWFDQQAPTTKRLVVVGVLALCAGGVYAGACWGLLSWPACGSAGMVEIVKLFIAAAIANQATFLLSPKA